MRRPRQLEHLVDPRLRRQLEFWPGIALPEPLRHPSSLNSTMLYRRGLVTDNPCLRVRGQMLLETPFTAACFFSSYAARGVLTSSLRSVVQPQLWPPEDFC